MSRLHLGSLLRAKTKVAALPVLGLLCGVGAAAAVTASLTPTYQATASVIVLPTPAGSSAEVRLSDVSLAQSLVSSVARLAESREVAVAVENGLTLPDRRVSGHIKGVSEPGIQIVKVQATADTPTEAAAIADAATKAMIKLSNRLTLGGSAVTVQPLDKAGVPRVPIAPRPALNYLLGALVGLLIGIGVATLRNRAGDRFRRVADVETELGLPALGIINRRTPRHRIRSARTLYARAEIGNAVDGLVSALSVLGERRAVGRRIFITSVGDEDSAAFVAALLAVGLQQEHATTLLEAKLRRSAIQRYFRDQSELRVADVLRRSLPADAGDAQAVLMLGAVSGYFDAEPRFDQVGALIDSLVATGDDVVVCVPPVLAGRGLSALAKHADIVILTVDSDRARRADAGRAALLVQRLGVQVAGIVVTGSAAEEDGWQPSSWPAVVAPTRTADVTTGDTPAAPVAAADEVRPARVVADCDPDKTAPLPTKTAPPTKSPA